MVKCTVFASVLLLVAGLSASSQQGGKLSIGRGAFAGRSRNNAGARPSHARTGPVMYSVTPLGSVHGEPNSFLPIDGTINDMRAAAGYSYLDTNNNDLFLTGRPFYCINGTLIPLPLVPGYPGAFAFGLTNNGQIFGTVNKQGLASTIIQAAVIWESGRPIVIGPGNEVLGSNALGMNRGGTATVVVYSENAPSYYATVWQGGKLTPLPRPVGVLYSADFGINDDGVIVGYVDYGPNLPAYVPEYHPTVWLPANGSYIPVELPNLGGDIGGANAVNDFGEVVGFGSDTSHNQYALYWYEGELVNLGMLPGGGYAEATWINNLGQIVGDGEREDGTDVPFVYQNGALTDLNDLVPTGTPPLEGNVGGINDEGQIAATEVLEDGTNVAVLLTPVR